MEEDLIIEIWDVFKEYITEKNKETAATHFVEFLIGKDVTSSVLNGIVGYDSYLDEAIDIAVGSDSSDEDEWDSYEDDE